MADFGKTLKPEYSIEGNASPKAEITNSEDNWPTQGNCVDLAVDKSSACSSKAEEKQPWDNQLSLITWNVDGLDPEDLPERARGFCSYLKEYTPDVVFIQELIPQYVSYLMKQATRYKLIVGKKEGYFTGMMFEKSRIELLQSQIVSYPTTGMGRNLLIARVKFQGQELCLMTSHLESCKPEAKERMNQLRLVLGQMTAVPDSITVVFGGDTNLRDAEVREVDLPGNIYDLWEYLGKRPHCCHTWDTRTNTNKEIERAIFFRFDRVYVRPATREGVPRLTPHSMALVGLEPLACGRFTSDHWGIYCRFSTA